MIGQALMWRVSGTVLALGVVAVSWLRIVSGHYRDRGPRRSDAPRMSA